MCRKQKILKHINQPERTHLVVNEENNGILTRTGKKQKVNHIEKPHNFAQIVENNQNYQGGTQNSKKMKFNKYNLYCFDNKFFSWCFWYLELFLQMIW